MMIVAFVVKGIVFTLLALGIAITVVTAGLALLQFIPAALASLTQSRFTRAARKT